MFVSILVFVSEILAVFVSVVCVGRNPVKKTFALNTSTMLCVHICTGVNLYICIQFDLILEFVKIFAYTFMQTGNLGKNFYIAWL